jgi:hypothetical protein
MPLYIVFILDLARGKGLMAKVFALPCPVPGFLVKADSQFSSGSPLY